MLAARLGSGARRPALRGKPEGRHEIIPKASRMTYATGGLDDVAPFDQGPLSQRVSSRTVCGAIALGLGVLMAAKLLDAYRPVAPKIEAPSVAPVASTDAPAADPTPIAAPERYVALLDSAYSLGLPPASLGQNAPLGPSFASPILLTQIPQSDTIVLAAVPAHSDLVQSASLQAPPAADAALSAPTPAAPDMARDVSLPAAPAVVVEPDASQSTPIPAASDLAQDVPLPAPRPPELQARAGEDPLRALGRPMAQQNKTTALKAAPPDNRTFIEKLFGMPKPSGPALAYAAPEAPDGGIFGNLLGQTSRPSLGYDHWTAVYDIGAHTVYMPDGRRLEAHSGLGERLDDPRYVSERNRGATPPHVYDLELRAQPFHGVQALRLNPIGGGGVYGRTGLLAHTYMLGPNGDSNGCVSFRNYNAFLQAFLNGEVKRLVVVARQS